MISECGDLKITTLKLRSPLRSWKKNVPNAKPENLKEAGEQKGTVKNAVRNDISVAKIATINL